MGKRHLAWRGMAVLYGATTIWFAFVFVHNAMRHPHVIRTGVLGYGLMTAAATWGLVREQQWGKQVAILIALGTSALGAFATLSAVLSHQGPLALSILLFVVATGLTYLLSLRIFNPPPSDEF